MSAALSWETVSIPICIAAKASAVCEHLRERKPLSITDLKITVIQNLEDCESPKGCWYQQ